MDLMKMIPNTNSVNRACGHEEDDSNGNKTAVCPTQGQLRESWSSVNAQVMLTANNLIEQQSEQWTPSQETEPVASMKIFTSVMLNAWRRRRADVQRLQLVVERLKTSSMQTKNELHVSNTLMRVEQKRCHDLQLELKKSTLSINQVRNSCEMLNTSVLSLTADKQQLELDLRQSRLEFDELQQETRKSKDDLLVALLEQRNLQQLLSTEQRLVHQLTREKEQLLDELTSLRNLECDYRSKEQSYIQEVEQKEEGLRNMSLTIKQLEQKLYDRSRQNPMQWHSPMNEQLFQESQEETDLDLTAISPRFQSKTFKSNCIQFIEWYGIDQLYSKVHYYSAKAAYIIWLALLPNKSVRNGCLPPRIRFSEE